MVRLRIALGTCELMGCIPVNQFHTLNPSAAIQEYQSAIAEKHGVASSSESQTGFHVIATGESFLERLVKGEGAT